MGDISLKIYNIRVVVQEKMLLKEKRLHKTDDARETTDEDRS